MIDLHDLSYDCDDDYYCIYTENKKYRIIANYIEIPIEGECFNNLHERDSFIEDWHFIGIVFDDESTWHDPVSLVRYLYDNQESYEVDEEDSSYVNCKEVMEDFMNNELALLMFKINEL